METYYAINCDQGTLITKVTAKDWPTAERVMLKRKAYLGADCIIAILDKTRLTKILNSK